MTIAAQRSTALADRYRIDRHLGEGGMVTVYVAPDVKHDRTVALEVLRPELATVIGGERFLDEIKVKPVCSTTVSWRLTSHGG